MGKPLFFLSTNVVDNLQKAMASPVKKESSAGFFGEYRQR